MYSSMKWWRYTRPRAQQRSELPKLWTLAYVAVGEKIMELFKLQRQLLQLAAGKESTDEAEPERAGVTTGLADHKAV